MTIYQRSYQIDYFYGWRYLLSAKFRNQVRQKWGNSRFLKSMSLIGSFTSILLTSAATILLIIAIWQMSGYF
jgi:hypothetical protein